MNPSGPSRSRKIIGKKSGDFLLDHKETGIVGEILRATGGKIIHNQHRRTTGEKRLHNM
ncbi:MAG: hypothetical protein SNJ84_06185 [Verrucomicrobiia bacterium]